MLHRTRNLFIRQQTAVINRSEFDRMIMVWHRPIMLPAGRARCGCLQPGKAPARRMPCVRTGDQLPLSFHRAHLQEPGRLSLSCNRNYALPRQLLRSCRNCWLHHVFHNVFTDLMPHVRPDAG